MTSYLSTFTPAAAYDGPARGPLGPLMSFAEKCEAAAAPGIGLCLAYSSAAPSFTTRQLFEQSPTLMERYKGANAIGDLLGRGKRSLGLHPAPRGGHLRCSDNANLLLIASCCPNYLDLRERMKAGESPADVLEDADLDDAALASLVDDLGFDDAEQLAHAISQLPAAADLQASPPSAE